MPTHALRRRFAPAEVVNGTSPTSATNAKRTPLRNVHSVSFTLDTYAHVLVDHKREGMALMEDLYNMAPISTQPNSYPLVITTQEDGTLLFTAPDFPAISFTGTDLQGGIQYVKERIEEELLTAVMPPMATPIPQITIAANQLAVQIAV